jgi:hypothetical protein
VRGGRHAWEMRLITWDALVRLLELDDPTTSRRIHQLLFPRELTKLDAIVDLLFFTAEDSKLGEVDENSMCGTHRGTPALWRVHPS